MKILVLIYLLCYSLIIQEKGRKMFIAYEPDNQMMFFFTKEERDAYVAEWWPFADTEPYETTIKMERE